MTFDLTRFFTQDPRESQQGEGGHNHDNNCVPTALTVCLQALGYPDIEPQTITDAMYGPVYHGGESFEAMMTWVHAHLDASLVMAAWTYGDIITLINNAGALSFPMIFLGHSDSAGNYVPYVTGIEHASVVLRHTNNWTVILNSERLTEVGMTDDDLRRCYGACLFVIRRGLGVAVNPSPVLPTLEEEIQVPGFTHTNGSRHWAYLDNNDIIHGVWNPVARQPEHLHVSNGRATKIIDFFQEPGKDTIVMIVDGMDGKEWYDADLAEGDDLAQDAKWVWVQR